MDQAYSLNMLVIDDDQLYIEEIVKLLRIQDISTSFTLLDDLEELDKALRQRWDVALFGHAYDIKPETLVDTIEDKGIALPIIGLLDDPVNPVSSKDSTDKRSLTMRKLGFADTKMRSQYMGLTYAIIQQLAQFRQQRKLQDLRTMLDEAEQRANILIRNSKSAVAYIQEGIHIYANDPYLEMFNLESLQELRGVPVIDLIAGDSVADFKKFLKNFSKGNRDDVEFVFDSVRPDGSTFEAKLQLAVASYEGEPCTQIIIQHNDANSAEMQAKLTQIERTDSLTGLSNRLAFEEYLGIYRQTAIKNKSQHALAYIQIDNIGQINTANGIKGTDKVVRTIAETLRDRFGEAKLSRFSDSVFTILIENVEKQDAIDRLEAFREYVASTLIESDNRTIKTSVSLGITLISETSPSPTDILNRAIAAINKVYIQTNNEGNGLHLYDPKSNASSSDTAMYEAIVQALDEDGFALRFQPIYDIQNDSSNFFEVSLSLPLPDGSIIRPDKFLGVAKEHNILGRIDRWVMINASKALKTYRDQDPTARLLIHMSDESIQDDSIPPFVAKLNSAVGGGNHPIALQFSERSVSDYLTFAKKHFPMYKEAGAMVAINNFGSAFKASDLFEHVQPDFVRLARNFVADLGNPENVDAVKDLIAQISKYDVDSLMAFIESPAAMSAAWSVGARYLQGSYLQEPLDSLRNVAENSS